MLSPAFIVWRMHILSAELTLYGTVGSGPDAFVLVELVYSEDSFAFGTEFIVFTALTLLKKVFIQS